MALGGIGPLRGSREGLGKDEATRNVRRIIRRLLANLGLGSALGLLRRRRSAGQASWRAQLERDEVRSLLSSDPRLSAILKLARAANAVLFCHTVLLNTDQRDKMPDIRQRINAFLYVSAILFEAIELAKTQSALLKDVDGWQEEFVPLFRDRNVQQLTATILKRIRNQGVFHFGDDEIVQAVQRMESDHFVFVAGSGQSSGGAYYVLPDEALLHAALGITGGEEDLVERLERLISRVAKMAAAFTGAADRVISVVLHEQGWRVVGAEGETETT